MYLTILCRKKALRARIKSWGDILVEEINQVQPAQLNARSKVWLECNGEVIFGGGRLALLEAIEETGSILQATRKLGISYRGAWGRINATEERLGFKLLDRQTGGKNSGATLTPEGKQILAAYRHFRKDCTEAIDNLFVTHFKDFLSHN